MARYFTPSTEQLPALEQRMDEYRGSLAVSGVPPFGVGTKTTERFLEHASSYFCTSTRERVRSAVYMPACITWTT